MDITQDAEKLAQQFYASQILRELTGKRVRFKTEVEREDFCVEPGALGTVQSPFMVDGLLVAVVKLDDPPEGSEPYEGEVHWLEDENLIDFEEEIELA